MLLAALTKGIQSQKNGLIRVAAMLRVYLDDSGKFADPYETVAVVAGVIADVEKWNSFDREWSATLDSFQVSELHMRHFSQSKGEFTNWKEDKRRSLLNSLCAITNQYVLKPIGAMIPLEQFQKLPADKRAAWLDDPYFVVLLDAIKLAVTTSEDLFDPPQDVQILCDEQPKFKAKAERVYRACQQQLTNGSRLVSFGFGSSKKFPGLQLADLVAYEALRVRRDILDPKKNVIDDMRWPMTQLLKKQADFEFYTEQELKDRTPLNLKHTA